VPALRRIIAKVDPEQPVSQVRTMPEIVAGDSASRAVQLRVLGAFAFVAILLAGIGLHGLLSFTVSSRSQEFGVRMALGAQRSNILGMVFRHGGVLAGAGVAAGVVLAYWSGRAMSALLVGLDPADFPTFLAVVVLCLAMTLAGSLVPAIKAVRLDPTQVMRGE
jgi:ABC-type antimicrobial peptide transport system permease subunit